MIEISIDSVLGELAEKLKSVDTDAMLREIASSILPEMRTRVHVEGKASDGSLIGSYSQGYMKVRTGNYPETKLKSGKNKGDFREKKKKGQAGMFSKGSNKGGSRPTYNRSADTNVVLSLTRQMENDMQVAKTNNGYGIGYSNEFNYNKAIWNQRRYKKNIWSLSDEELNLMKNIATKHIKN